MQHPEGAGDAGGDPPCGAAPTPPPTMPVYSLPPPPPAPASSDVMIPTPTPASSDVMIPTPTMLVFSLPQPPPAPASGEVMIPTPTQPAAPEEFQAAAAAGSGSAAAVKPNDDAMMVDVDAATPAAGGGGSGSSGNRWPRDETLALIRIRSEMDAAFRNATLKTPVWEELSRKLAKLGYQRSAQKCKEKFENVNKYYKRTKEGRAGRQSYRFFPQLEALHAAASQRQHQSGMPVEDPRPLSMARMLPAMDDLGFLSMSSEEDDSETDGDETDGEGDDEAPDGHDDDDYGAGEGSRSRSSRKQLMAMFEGMMKQVTEKQDAMQRAFMEALEKWESERIEREEAWRRKEVARINREREILSQERAAAATRDAAVIAFLQRVGATDLSPSSAAAAARAAGLQLTPVPPAPRAKKAERWVFGEGSSSGTTASPSPSRWPKQEVQALINLRMEKEEQYSEMGPKGALWEEIAAGMQRIGYNRSAKRCKEKWENINKYFKKVKESNKRRPEDSKTCPYFHQLDAIYRKKQYFAGRGSGGDGGVTIASAANSLAIVVVPEQEINQRELEGKSSNDGNLMQAVPLLEYYKIADDKEEEGTEGIEAEPIIREEEEETESDEEMGGNYTDEGDDDDKMQYKIEFQNPNAGGGGDDDDDAPAPATAAAATGSTSTPTPTNNTSSVAVQ
uniref:Myb-like domain-containing protein n=1 Tax=Leersia perrieri TaxID=77586 RepID=A0A0D9VIX0_9ORYZ